LSRYDAQKSGKTVETGLWGLSGSISSKLVGTRASSSRFTAPHSKEERQNVSNENRQLPLNLQNLSPLAESSPVGNGGCFRSNNLPTRVNFTDKNRFISTRRDFPTRIYINTMEMN